MNTENQIESIDIYCIIHDVIKELWVAVIIGVSIALLSYIVIKLGVEPTYTSSTTLVVSAKENNNNGYVSMNEAEMFVDSFKSVINSNILKTRVCENLGVDTFPGEVEVEVVPETNLMTISVKSDQPQTSFRTLKCLMAEYPSVGEKVLGENVIDVFEKPAYPSHADKTMSTKKIMEFTALIATLAMMIVFAVKSVLKDTVKTEKDVHNKLAVQSIVTLAHEKPYASLKKFLKREKKRIYISEPTVSFNYRESVKKLCTEVKYHLDKTNSKVVLVTSTGMGEGKSTVAYNLAKAFSIRKSKVLLIEGDIRRVGNLNNLMSDKVHLRGWTDYIVKNVPVKNIVTRPDYLRYDVLPNISEVNHSSDLLSSKQMKNMMDDIRNIYDVVIIDGPKIKGRADAEIYAGLSDFSILVVKQNEIEAQYINDSIDMLSEYGNGIIGCVFNNVNEENKIISSLSYGYGYGYGYGYKYSSYGKYGKYGSYDRMKDLNGDNIYD